MYSYDELNAVTLSPTKKDYYQIWTELLDVSKKLSERWDPANTNESDPGVVLLKVLTAVADKLSYNIDANTLEAFMPSAAQEASVRKLCDMLGYSMRYYESAVTKVRITYNGEAFPSDERITIDRFTSLKDTDGTVNYITLEPVVLDKGSRKFSQIVDCMEGELIQCESDSANVISLSQLDDNFRYWLPEKQVAANGIFVCNVEAPTDFWSRETNLNTQLLGSKVFSFGFAAETGLPYIQFPEDIGSLIGAGLYISFVRTKGSSGNISVGTLRQMEKPQSWSTSETDSSKDLDTYMQGVAIDNGTAPVTQDVEEVEKEWLDLEKYTIHNINAAKTGKDPETIDEAYWNYQKTIGTFDTLVTCRDYMNKIYQMTKSDTDNTPLVSNIIVSDIRDDINKAYQIGMYEPAGIIYKSCSKPNKGITHFDLILYPFTYAASINNPDEFKKTFNFDQTFTNVNSMNRLVMLDNLEDNKTIAHNIIFPTVPTVPTDTADIACVKVYSQYSARVTTTAKVSDFEATSIEENINKALYEKFNCRAIDFGVEIPFDAVQQTMLNADSRIKNIILDDPKLYVAITTVSGKEYPLFDENYEYNTEAEAKAAKTYYLDIIAKNVMAGRVPLYNIDNSFSTSLQETTYPIGSRKTDSTASVVVAGTYGTESTFKAGAPAKLFGLGSTQSTESATKPLVQLLKDGSGQLVDVKSTHRVLVGQQKKQFAVNLVLQEPGTEIVTDSVAVEDQEATRARVRKALVDLIDYVSIRAYMPGANSTKPTFEAQLCTTSLVKGQQLIDTWQSSAQYDENTFESKDTDKTEVDSIDLFNDTLAVFELGNKCPNIILPSYIVEKPAESDISRVTTTYSAQSAFILDKLSVALNINISKAQECLCSLSAAEAADAAAEYYKKLLAHYLTNWSIQIQELGAATDNVSPNPDDSGDSGNSEENQVEYAAFLSFDDTAANEQSVVQLNLSQGNTTLDPLYNLESLQDLKLKPEEVALPLPTSIQPLFLVDTAGISNDDPLTLGPNEVIKFRAPNFRTSITYPAYVNYFAKLSDRTIQKYLQGSGKINRNIPATMYSLREFLNGGPDGYEDHLLRLVSRQSIITKDSEAEKDADNNTPLTKRAKEKYEAAFPTEQWIDLVDAEKLAKYQEEVELEAKAIQESVWSPKKSLEEKLSTMPNKLKESLMLVAFKKASKASPEALATSVRQDNNLLERCILQYKTAFIKAGDVVDKASYGFGSKQDTDFIPLAIYTKDSVQYGDSWYHFKTYINLSDIQQGASIYYMKPTSSSLEALASWAQGKTSEAEASDAVTCRINPESMTELILAAGDDYAPAIIEGAVLPGLYTRSQSNLARVPSQLIDQNLYKYTPATTLTATITADNIFVPILWQDEIETHTKDGLGRTAELVGIPANTEYQLGADEYILLNYTSSEGTSDGSAVVKNVMLGQDTIIKANFELIDSRELSASKAFYKTSGYGPWQNEHDSSVVNSAEVPGMYAFSASEQLEVREIIRVTLNEDDTYLCWEIKDRILDAKNGAKVEYFPIGPAANRLKYVLKPGEYVFYTNSKKESMAYYGAGTEIAFECESLSDAPSIYRDVVNSISVDDLEDLGFVQALPWTQLAPNTLSEHPLIITEYQQITLAEGDSLGSIDLADSDSGAVLNNIPKVVTSADFKVGGLASKLSNMNLKREDFYWEVSTSLDLAVGPDTPQDLRATRNKYGKEVARDIICFMQKDKQNNNNVLHLSTPLCTASADGTPEAKPMRLYTDTALVCSNSDFVLKYSYSGNPEDTQITVAEIKDKKTLGVKTCYNSGPLKFTSVLEPDGAGEQLSADINEYGFYNLMVDPGSQFSLSLTVPADDYCLLPIYIDYKAEAGATGLDSTVYLTYSQEECGLGISNLSSSPDNLVWWNGLRQSQERSTYYQLLDVDSSGAINNILVPKSGTLTITVPTQVTANMLRIGKPRLLKITESGGSASLLNTALYSSDIKFKVKNNSVITIGPQDVADAIRDLDPHHVFYPLADTDGRSIETYDASNNILAPLVWFDRQNAVNKFVVSVLDADYAMKMIKVSRFSKR